MANSSNKTIGVCGFDVIEFQIPNKPLKILDYDIDFFPYTHNGKSFDDYEGIIIPSGIFEKIGHDSSFVHGRFDTLQFDYEHLLTRQREVRNLLKKKKWICFVVGEIIDAISRPGSYDLVMKDVSKTDLCKIVMNEYGINRRNIRGLSHLKAKTNEFQRYVEKFGVAKTILEPHYKSEGKKIIVAGDNTAVGFVEENQVFFLPFHTTSKTFNTLKELLNTVVYGVTEFIKAHEYHLPVWLNDFAFEEEEGLKQKHSELTNNLVNIEKDIKVFTRYKGILTNKSDNLVNQVVSIFKVFFNLNIEAQERYNEDLKILDDNDSLKAIVEVKGVNSGIKREYINQVDSHRERLSISSETIGLLIINNNMSATSFKDKEEAEVANEHIKHAENLNILILRTIDLLYIMKSCEKLNLDQRRDKFIKLISNGGGWLKWDKES